MLPTEVPFTESWVVTAKRTGLLAVAIGLVAGLLRRNLSIGAAATLAALWFTLGGHFGELLFRNTIRPRLPFTLRQPSRLIFWFAAGSVLYLGASMTFAAIHRGGALSFPWWGAGLGFVVVELLIHARIQALNEPNFYDGRG